MAKESRLSRPGVVALLAMVSCALWGSAFAFVKEGYRLFGIESGNPSQQLVFAGMRFALAGILVLIGTALIRRKLPLPTKDDLVPIALLGLSQTTLQYAPFYIGLAHASGTNASLVQGTSAFVQILLATLVFRQEKLTARKLAGCLLGVGGVALVTLSGGEGLGSFSLVGEGLVLLAVIAGGCAACFMRRFGAKGDPLMLTGWQFLAGGLGLMLIGVALGGRVSSFSGAGAAVLLYLGALSATAFSLWSMLLKHNPVSRVAVYRFLIPMFGVVFSVAVLGEAIPAGQLMQVVLALVLIAAGTVLVNTEPRRQEVP